MKGHKSHQYFLQERPEADISLLWQVLQIAFMGFCALCGFTICFCLGHVTHVLQYNCVLFSNLSFRENFTLANHSTPFDIEVGSSLFFNEYCDIVMYLPVVISTFACFFVVMFVYCGRGGAGQEHMPDSWRIVLPTVVFNLASFCVAIFVNSLLQRGLRATLRSIAKVWHKERVNLSEIGHLHMGGVRVGEEIIFYLTLTKHAVWLLVSFWGLNVCWIALRCVFNVDFQLMRTTIQFLPITGGEVILRKKTKKDDDSGSEASRESDIQDNNSARLRKVQFTPSTRGVAFTGSTGWIVPEEEEEEPGELSAPLRTVPEVVPPSPHPDEAESETELAQVLYDNVTSSDEALPADNETADAAVGTSEAADALATSDGAVPSHSAAPPENDDKKKKQWFRKYF